MTTHTTKADLSQASQAARAARVARAEQACAEGESALERGDTGTAEACFRQALRLAGVVDGGAGGDAGGLDIGGDGGGLDVGGAGVSDAGGDAGGPDAGNVGFCDASAHTAGLDAGGMRVLDAAAPTGSPDAGSTRVLDAVAPTGSPDAGSTGASDTSAHTAGPDAGGTGALDAAALTGGLGTGGQAADVLPEGVARLAARAWTGAGRARLARGESEGAEVEFERAHALRPSAAGPLHWLGCAAAHRGDFAAAERHLTASLACAVPHGRSLVQRAYVHARAGHADAALDDLRAAALAGSLDDEARWLFAVLSGRTAREVALRLRRAALAALAPLAPHGGFAARGDEGWRRAGELLAAARWLGPGPWPSSPLYAVALMRGGRRAAAVALLDDAVRDDPADHRVTHTLAICLLNSPTDHRGSRWERCIAAWAALLHDAGFWAHVLSSASRRYGVTVEPSLVPVLRAGLREVLERRMPDDAGTRVAPGPLLQREADAAKLLAAVGGFPSSGGGGAALFCGPLRIADLGRSAEFGAFAAAWERSFADAREQSNADARDRSFADTREQSFADARDQSNADARDRTLADTREQSFTGARAQSNGGVQALSSAYASLTYAFSELGFAQLLLGQDKAADALAALSELRCPGCRARGGPGAAAVCEPACGRFDELNPGYAGVPDKHLRLSLDARGLALEARLSMGRSEMTSARPDFGAAAAYWRRALVHSREIDRYRETQTAIVDMALGAARAAHRDGRLSLAVSTLDATRSVIGANERGRLEGQLARVLADRGISVANDEEALLDRPAADLRRSVAFNPHLLRAQVSLGIVLRGLAAARWSSGSLSGARDTLHEAVDQLTAALMHFPDDPDLEEQREAAVADLNHVMWQPDESEQ
ncbi:tetratricopeptide repeat protein [Streptomyces sp. Je 1-369]|uniref:tetratricopeptide repeat protein n=1 Tax=Streptomyces sp. Je 1-369 TaxID=2966192 RepID=UPI002286C697|nr:hypothetical protein [Streptomyces sp. Je 1-369]WAL98545.1 hypothetical protein NOO62_31090 [Streptomyces sp. Je 1-369]